MWATSITVDCPTYFVSIEAGMAIVLWIGIVIVAQSFSVTPRHHAPAVVVGLLPAIAAADTAINLGFGTGVNWAVGHGLLAILFFYAGWQARRLRTNSLGDTARSQN